MGWRRPTMANQELEMGDAYYPQLLNVARSAGLDLSNSPKKDDLIERMREAGIERVDWNEWTIDGEPLELQPAQTSTGSSEPRDETVLYCLPRESTEDHIDEVRAALEDAGFDIRAAGQDEDNYKIVLPAEADDHDEDADLDELTYDELYDLASELDIDGRSDMDSAELREAIEDAR